MPDTTTRVSVALTAQVRDDGAFPSMTTYPASFERYLTSGKVFAATGTLTGAPVQLSVVGTLATIKVWYVEAGPTGTLTVADAPVNGTVPAGQIVLATNENTGWTASTVTVSGNAAYKIIAIGG